MSRLLVRRLAGLANGICAMLVTCLTVAGQTSVCQNDGAFYAQKKYAVRKIIIETPLSGHLPLGFLFGLESRLQTYFDSLKPALSLQEGKLFSNTAYGKTAFELAQIFGALKPGERFRLAYPVPQLVNCNDDVRVLDVRFRVYTSDYLSFLSRAFEAQPEKITRALLPLALTASSKFQVAPLVGYNRSRGVFGGTQLSLKTPWGPLKRTEVNVSGSSSSATVNLGIIGDHQFKDGALDRVEWRLAYRYFDLPADTVRHKSGALFAQAFVSTKPLSWHNLVLRFGSSLEGGHLQTELAEPAAVTSELLRTRYGSLKTYIGGTMKFGRQALKGSYGLQLGQTGKGASIDYVKQVFDSAYSVRFLPREHMPLQLDTQFSAGKISSPAGLIPLAERFYGGNTRRNFIQGDDWQINSDPFLRSFPQNRFNRTDLAGARGGTGFFALNLTAAQTVWKRTLVPEELIRNPALYGDLKIKLRGLLENQRGGLGLSLLTETAEFPALEQKFYFIGDLFNEINAVLGAPEIAAVTGTAADLLSEANIQTNAGLELVASYRETKDIGPFRELLSGFDADTPPVAKACADALDAFLAEINAPSLQPQKDKLTTLSLKLRANWTTADQAYRALRNQLLIDPAHLQGAQPLLAAIKQSLTRIQDTLKQIESSPTAGLTDERLNALRVSLQLAQKFNAQALEDAKLESGGESDNVGKGANLLAEGYDVAVARLKGLTESLNALRPLLFEAKLEDQWKKLVSEIASLRKFRRDLKHELAKIPYSQTQHRVTEAVDYTGNMFDVIFREMNLVSISPVALFDVARLGPNFSRGQSATRYGIGGGVRFSLVSLDVTAAYSWNLHRRPGEGRGALVFSLNVSDLFR